MPATEIARLTTADFKKLGAMVVAPEPRRLIRDFTDVFNIYCGLDDPSRGGGQKFLEATAKKKMLSELNYVVLGLLSDKPGFSMCVTFTDRNNAPEANANMHTPLPPTCPGTSKWAFTRRRSS